MHHILYMYEGIDELLFFSYIYIFILYRHKTLYTELLIHWCVYNSYFSIYLNLQIYSLSRKLILQKNSALSSDTKYTPVSLWNMAWSTMYTYVSRYLPNMVRRIPSIQINVYTYAYFIEYQTQIKHCSNVLVSQILHKEKYIFSIAGTGVFIYNLIHAPTSAFPFVLPYCNVLKRTTRVSTSNNIPQSTTASTPRILKIIHLVCRRLRSKKSSPTSKP